MRPTDLGLTQIAIATEQFRSILAAGFAGSLCLHLGIIAGINYWWQPQVDINEPIEITLVEPVEVDIISPSPSPIVKPIIQPNPAPKITPVTPISRPNSPPRITSVMPISRPIIASTPTVIPTPSPKLTPTSPISKRKSIAVKSTPKPQPQPKSRAIYHSPTPNPTPIFNPPFPVEPRSIAPMSIKPSPVPQQISTPQPVKRTVIKPKAPPRQNPHSIENNDLDDDLPDDRDPVSPAVVPPVNLQPKTVAGADSKLSEPSPAVVPPVNLQPKTVAGADSKPLEQPLGRGKIAGNWGGDKNPMGSIPAGTGQQANPTSSPSQNRGNSTSQNGSKSAAGVGGNATAVAPSGSSAKSDSGGSKLECIKYCEIPQLRDLQDTDAGKDRLQIRIIVDANGLTSDASIAKSSGNPQIDSVVLRGIKQMQFAPSGKEVRGIVKANILIRSANYSVIFSIA